MSWSPTRIQIECQFDRFVEESCLGKRVDKVARIPDGYLNADYYFSDANVIAELKTLEADPRAVEVFGRRLAAAYAKCGYSGSDFFRFLLQGEAIPAEVQRKFLAVERRSLLNAISKADKQIRATKRLLGTTDTRGLILVANDNNYGLTPGEALDVMCQAFRAFERKECHTDGIVYLSPNVYYDDGTYIAKSVWIPVYNIGSENLADFVNVLGKEWGDFNESPDDPYLVRSAEPDMSPQLITAKPIATFKRPRRQ